MEIFTVAVVYFTNQNRIPKTFYCIRCVMVCKTGFANQNKKIAVLRASMVVTYFIKLFRAEVDRHNGILISLLLLVAETINLNDAFFNLILLAICKFYLTVLTWNLVSNLYYRLCRSYVNNENFLFKKYVLSFILFVYTYTKNFV